MSTGTAKVIAEAATSPQSVVVPPIRPAIADGAVLVSGVVIKQIENTNSFQEKISANTAVAAIPGIAATAVFALIFSWNEFVFSIFLITSPETRTAPAAIAGLIGGTTVDWGLVAASAMVFAIPVLVFAFLVRKYLVAGVTLGAVRR